MSGFIRLERGAFNHHLLKDAERFRAWFWLVQKACWKPREYDLNGKTIRLDRGQLCVSRSQLAKEWGWSPSAVERFLTRLKTERMVGRETGQGRSVITIRNYEKYNPTVEQTGQDNEQATGQRPDRQRTAKEQGNKGTTLSNESGKARFWSSAKEFLGGKNPGALIGKWLRDYGEDATSQAITAAQLANAVDPVSYIERILRGSGGDKVVIGI